MNKFFLAILAILFITGSSCKKENRCDCIKRTGDIVSELRTVDAFDRIYLEDNVNVFITQDSVFEVKVEAGEHLISLIKTEVTNGEIKITNKNRCNWARSYKPQVNVYLRMPAVKYITSDGVGTIKSINTITTSTFDYRLMSSGDLDLTVNNNEVIGHMHGAGDVYLHGTTNHHAVNIVGNGFINAGDLETSYTWILSRTSGNIYVRARDLLQVSIIENGDIYYSGNPATIDKVITGTGNLIAQ
jgi:hypothetical protein